MEAITSHPLVLLVVQLGSFGALIWIVIQFSRSIEKKDAQLQAFYKETLSQLVNVTGSVTQALSSVASERHMLVEELRRRPCLERSEQLKAIDEGIDRK